MTNQIYNKLLSVHTLVSLWSNLNSSSELQGQKVSQSTVENISETWGRDRRGVWRRWRRRNLGWRPTPCGGPLCHTRQVLHRRGVGLRRLRYSSTGHQPEDPRAGGGQDHQQEKWVVAILSSMSNYKCPYECMYEWWANTLVCIDLDPEDDQDVRNEALIMRSLDHSNVVKLLDFIEAEKFFYLIIGTVFTVYNVIRHLLRWLFVIECECNIIPILILTCDCDRTHAWRRTFWQNRDKGALLREVHIPSTLEAQP